MIQLRYRNINNLKINTELRKLIGICKVWDYLIKGQWVDGLYYEVIQNRGNEYHYGRVDIELWLDPLLSGMWEELKDVKGDKETVTIIQGLIHRINQLNLEKLKRWHDKTCQVWDSYEGQGQYINKSKLTYIVKAELRRV